MNIFTDKNLTFADENKAFIEYSKLYCNVLNFDTSYGCI
jgi:hypothetical protein